MGAGICWTLAAPTQRVGTGAEEGCVQADLTLGTSMGVGVDWTPITPTQGVGIGAETDRASASLEGRAGTNWVLAPLTRETDTSAGEGWTTAAQSVTKCDAMSFSADKEKNGENVTELLSVN